MVKMNARWAHLQNRFCGRGDAMSGFGSGGRQGLPALNRSAAPRQTDARFGEALPLRARTFRQDRGRRAASACLTAVLAIHGAFFATGCRGARPSAPAEMLERFVPAKQVARRSSLLNPIVVDRAGSKKKAMVLVAPASAKAPLGGDSGRIELQLEAVPVFNVGDGIQMEIWLLDDGPPARICSRYFDPGRRFEDRRWTPVKVEMNVHRKDAQLEIRVSAGPEGNLTGDWLAFADVSISRKKMETP